MLCLVISGGWILGAVLPVEAAKATRNSCQTCHPSFTSLLPKGHPQVTGKNISSCSPCHQPDFTGKAAPNAYSARLHRAHQGKTDCLLCHAWVADKSFGLLGQKRSWGAPSAEDLGRMKKLMASWVTSAHLDHRHGAKNITCAGCHGGTLPKEGDSVENERCLTCHGPLETLQTKTTPPDFADRNPHKSHLGQIACTVCHKGHDESAVYCLQCHPKFQMKLR